MVSTVKRITTKKSGEMMAFVTVEGLEGSVEMLCFPAIYQENRELLVEDKVVKIKGRVDHKDETETKFIPVAIEAFVPKTGRRARRHHGGRRAAAPHHPRRPEAVIAHFPGACPVEVQVLTRGTPAGTCASATASGSIRRPASSPS